MTISEATQAIGQPFKYSLCSKWDVIKEVRPDGYIIGEFIEAPADECRLKQEIPEGLKKYQNGLSKEMD